MAGSPDYRKTLEIPEVLSSCDGKITSAAEFEAVRDDMIKMLETHMYGRMPKKPNHLQYETADFDPTYLGGIGCYKEYKVYAEFDNGTVSFSFRLATPKTNGKKPPLILHLSHYPYTPNPHQPTEEILENGFAVCTLYYRSVTPSDGDFRSGNAKILAGSRRSQTSSGKIAMWAWAVIRTIEVIEVLDSVDLQNIAVAGYDTLAKSVLLAAAYDKRIKYTCAHGAGVCGDSIIRKSDPYMYSYVIRTTPYWFCPKFARYECRLYRPPFDQHFLLSLIAPRRIIILTAKNDNQANPASQYLALKLTNPVYNLYGLTAVPEVDFSNESGCHLEEHCLFDMKDTIRFFNRGDWHKLMDFIKACMEKE